MNFIILNAFVHSTAHVGTEVRRCPKGTCNQLATRTHKVIANHLRWHRWRSTSCGTPILPALPCPATATKEHSARAFINSNLLSHRRGDKRCLLWLAAATAAAPNNSEKSYRINSQDWNWDWGWAGHELCSWIWSWSSVSERINQAQNKWQRHKGIGEGAGAGESEGGRAEGGAGEWQSQKRAEREIESPMHLSWPAVPVFGAFHNWPNWRLCATVDWAHCAIRRLFDLPTRRLSDCELCAAYGQDYAIGVARVQAQQEAASTGPKGINLANLRGLNSYFGCLQQPQHNRRNKTILFLLLGTFN